VCEETVETDSVLLTSELHGQAFGFFYATFRGQYCVRSLS